MILKNGHTSTGTESSMSRYILLAVSNQYYKTSSKKKTWILLECPASTDPLDIITTKNACQANVLFFLRRQVSSVPLKHMQAVTETGKFAGVSLKVFTRFENETLYVDVATAL
jgi:hypothetical protein